MIVLANQFSFWLLLELLRCVCRAAPCRAVLLQSIVTYTQRMQAAGKPAVIEPPLHQQAAAGATGAVADQDSDDEDRWAHGQGIHS